MIYYDLSLVVCFDKIKNSLGGDISIFFEGCTDYFSFGVNEILGYKLSEIRERLKAIT